MKSFESVDEYIKFYPNDVQEMLEKLRTLIKKNAPKAVETISYGMPAYKINGKPLVYFAAFKKHIGLYATPSAQAAFSQKLSTYKQGKGSVQFPLNKALPMELIEQIIQFKIKEIQQKVE